jgi:hypothetical protein
MQHPEESSRRPSCDHIRPRSKGFTLNPENQAIVCQPWNTDKGSRSLASFLFRLRRAADPRASFVAAFYFTTRNPRGSADIQEIEPTSIEVTRSLN